MPVVCGGHDGSGGATACYGYDLKGDSWTHLGNMPTGRYYSGILESLKPFEEA